MMEQGSHEAVVFAGVDPKMGTLKADVMVCCVISGLQAVVLFYRKLAQMQKLDSARLCTMDG